MGAHLGLFFFKLINPFEPNPSKKIKNSARTAKKTLHFTVTKINWLTLFKEIIAVNKENHTEHKVKSY
jgi:hypothetical protein